MIIPLGGKTCPCFRPDVYSLVVLKCVWHRAPANPTKQGGEGGELAPIPKRCMHQRPRRKDLLAMGTNACPCSWSCLIPCLYLTTRGILGHSHREEAAAWTWAPRISHRCHLHDRTG
jgi:hypothetical protein